MITHIQTLTVETVPIKLYNEYINIFIVSVMISILLKVKEPNKINQNRID